MWPRRLSLSLSSLITLTTCLVAGNALAQGEAPRLSPTDPEAPRIVLYDQIDNPGTNAITSQNFEPDLDAYDGQAADDFVVPAGEFWTITSVEISGTYATSATVDSVNVQFYLNTGAGLPGGLAYNGTLVPSGGLNTGSFIINLSPPAKLGPGRHWLSLQANMDFAGANVWQWRERTLQSGNAAAFRNPGGGFTSTCPNWGRLWDVCFVPADNHSPDLLFRLNGNTGPAFSLYLPLLRR
jgi:hypothetical protein